MTRGWLIAIGLAACGSAQPAPVTGGASELEPRTADCATKETFVEAGDSALEGLIVNCMTGEKIPEVQVYATGIADTTGQGDTLSDASGRYRLQLPEGRYRVLVVYDGVDVYNLEEVEIRAQHATVKEIRFDVPRCPPARGRPAVAPLADRTALIAAVLDHHAVAGIVDAPRRSDPGLTYVTIQGLRTLALPPDNARQYIVTTQDHLQREATRSGREIWFINIFGFEIAESCATVSVGGDFVDPNPKGIVKMCCCRETEVFLRRGGRWAFRMSRGDTCF